MSRSSLPRAALLLPCLAFGATACPGTAAAGGRSSVHLVSGVLGLLGAATATGALVTPLVLCSRSGTTTDAYGQVESNSSCPTFSQNTEVAWAATVGIGLTLAIVGGIVFFQTGPDPATSAQSTLVVAPWLAPSRSFAREEGTTPSGGLAVTFRF